MGGWWQLCLQESANKFQRRCNCRLLPPGHTPPIGSYTCESTSPPYYLVLHSIHAADELSACIRMIVLIVRGRTGPSSYCFASIAGLLTLGKGPPILLVSGTIGAQELRSVSSGVVARRPTRRKISRRHSFHQSTDRASVARGVTSTGSAGSWSLPVNDRWC